MNNMTICQIVDQLKGGGQERVAVELSNRLMVRGHRVIMLSTRRAGDYVSKLSAGVETIIMHRRSIVDLRSWLFAFRELDRLQPSVLHAHTPGSWGYASMIKLFSGSSTRTYMHVQMWPPRGSLWRFAAKACALILEHQIDGVFVTNRTLARDMIHMGYEPGKVTVVCNPVYFPRDPYIRRVSSPVVKVIMVSQWRRQKDPISAIRAISCLRRRGLLADLTIVGALEDAELVEEARIEIARLGLQEAVSILGRRTDVGELLAEADVGLLSTHFEGLPVSVIEYCAAALPVVVTDVEGTESLLSPENGVFGVPPSDPEAMAEALSRLYEPSRRVELGRLAFSYMAARAAADEVCRRVEAVFLRKATNIV